MNFSRSSGGFFISSWMIRLCPCSSASH